jgi:Zn finger protein HypA/HybF involved in hydrogenase expression
MSQPSGRKPSVDSKEKIDKSSLCAGCQIVVKESDKGVNCETCGNWYHIQCQNITVDVYKIMIKEEFKIMHWFCTKCESDTLSVGKVVFSMKARQDKMEADFAALKVVVSKREAVVNQELCAMKKLFTDLNAEKHFKDIQQEMTKMQANIAEMKEDFAKGKLTESDVSVIVDKKLTEHGEDVMVKLSQDKPMWSEVVSKHVDTKLKEVTGDITKVQQVLEDTKQKAQEEKERELRANNVIIYRVPESSNSEDRGKEDKKYCVSLVKEALAVDVTEDDFVKVFRLGKRGDTCRPLLLQFRERTIKNRVMESLFKLKNAQDVFRNISVTHDMTQQERQACKTLVEEAKTRQSNEQGEFKWRVRGLPGMLKLIRVHK